MEKDHWVCVEKLIFAMIMYGCTEMYIVSEFTFQIHCIEYLYLCVICDILLYVTN